MEMFSFIFINKLRNIELFTKSINEDCLSITMPTYRNRFFRGSHLQKINNNKLDYKFHWQKIYKNFICVWKDRLLSVRCFLPHLYGRTRCFIFSTGIILGIRQTLTIKNYNALSFKTYFMYVNRKPQASSCKYSPSKSSQYFIFFFFIKILKKKITSSASVLLLYRAMIHFFSRRLLTSQWF